MYYIYGRVDLASMCITRSHNPLHLRSVLHLVVIQPLSRPYIGAFRIPRRSEKHFTLDVNGKTEVVTTDRLKPATLERYSIPLASDLSISTLRPPAVSTQLDWLPVRLEPQSERPPCHFSDYVTE